MKKTFYILFITACFLTASDSNLTELDKKIEMLNKLPPEKRYKLMNEIKQEILKLNEMQRLKILKKLLKSQNIQTQDTEEDLIIENPNMEGK
ncbi:hypothetical protein [Caminibacter sp.]